MKERMFIVSIAALAAVCIWAACDCEALDVPEPTPTFFVAATVVGPSETVVEDTDQLTAEQEETILLEDERIEAALVEQGYYRNDIPLTYLEQDFLHTSCEEFGVPYELAVAVVWRETNFRNVTGDDGASVGYMQVQERWHRERMERLGVTDLTDPYSNFRVGCSYLGELLEKYGDTHKALMAYNTGPTSAAKLWRQGVATSKYSRAVIEYMEGLK